VLTMPWAWPCSNEQTGEAETELIEAGRLDPKNPFPLQGLGELYAATGKPEQALQSYESALKIAPRFIEANLGRGDVFLAMGKYEKALEEYSAVFKVNPDFAPAHAKIGMVHQSNGKLEDARQSYQKAIKLNRMFLSFTTTLHGWPRRRKRPG